MTDAVEPVAEPAETPAPVLRKHALTPLGLVIAGLFGLVYAYFVYQAIRNIIELPKSYSTIGLGESVPWPLLVIGLAIPVILYVLAFVIGLRRPVLDTAIVFILGLVTASALFYGVIAVHRVLFDALIATL